MYTLLKQFVISVLLFEARLLLRRTKPKIIGITGSVGKTTTKDAIYAVLKGHTHVRKSQKSYNSTIGVALTVLGLENAWGNPFLWCKAMIDGAFIALFTREYPEVLVLEMGVDRPGDMDILTSLVTPDIVVLTRLPDVPVHVEFFASPKDVCEEKMTLVRALAPDGVLVYNNDDEIIRSYLPEVRQKTISYGRYAPADFKVKGDRVLYDGSRPTGMEYTITHGQDAAPVRLQHVLGVQHIYNVAAAVAVGSQFGVSLEQAAAAFASFESAPGRMRLIAGVRGTTLIDDTYNSSPIAAERALETLAELDVPAKKVAILGDMLELGQFSVAEHTRIGTIAGTAVDRLITVGVRSRATAEAARAAGLDASDVFQFEHAAAVIAALDELVGNDDVVLIKGSQSIRTERITKALMARPEQAAACLVRHDSVWLAKP